MEDKRAEFSFVWIFAILVGSAILILAIYGAIKTGDTQRLGQDSLIALQLDTLTDPLQSGFAEGSTGKIVFSRETIIHNACFEEGEFGRGEIAIQTQSGIGNEWNPPGIPAKVNGKYLFSKEETAGEQFSVVSSTLRFPYKVAEILVIVDKNYCFYNPPESIKEGFAQIPNFQITEGNEECDLEGAEMVCFIGQGAPLTQPCSITVFSAQNEFKAGEIARQGKAYPYVEGLFYAALIADEEIYECNIKRVMSKAAALAEVYEQKIQLMSLRECYSEVAIPLAAFKATLGESGGAALLQAKSQAGLLDSLNFRGGCKVW